MTLEQRLAWFSPWCVQNKHISLTRIWHTGGRRCAQIHAGHVKEKKKKREKVCTHFQHSVCESHKTLHSWNCSSPPGNANSVNVIRLRDITVMCLMQHNHIPRRAYKTNLSVPAGLSKTRTVINCLQASETVCISTPSRWQNTGGCPVGKFYLMR